MKLSKLIRELSVARDKIKIDPEVGIAYQDPLLANGIKAALIYKGSISKVYESCCKIDNENTILLMLGKNE